MKYFLLLSLCWTLAPAQQYPPFNVDLGTPPVAADAQNQTWIVEGSQQNNATHPAVEASEQNNLAGNGQDQSNILPEAGNIPGVIPGMNDLGTAGTQQQQPVQENPWGVNPQPGIPQAVPGDAAAPLAGQQFPPAPAYGQEAANPIWGGEQLLPAGQQGTTAAATANTDDMSTASVTASSAGVNATTGNSTTGSTTIGPNQSGTTAGYVNPWDALKNWWYGQTNTTDVDDDYYDDDYYDDDYYDDYFNLTKSNESSPYFDWAEDVTTDTWASTTLPPSVATSTPSPCPLSAVSLDAACIDTDGVDGLKLSLKDVSEIVFDESVINALILGCSPGQWCLKDASYFNPLKTDGFAFFCNYTNCLSDYAGQCNTEERTLVTSSLRALCSMSSLNTSQTCSLQVKMLLHVALADYRRSQLGHGTEEVCGMQNQSSVSCGNNKASCLSVAESFSCLADTCLTDNLRSVWSKVPFWQWYFWDPIYMNEMCQITNVTDCNYILPQPEHQRFYLVQLDNLDNKMMTGMATALVVALAGFVVAVWACVKRFSGGYTRDKVQYAEIRDANFDHV